MWSLLIGAIVASVVGAAATIGVSASQNKTNQKLVSDTNQANLQAVRETNEANKELADLAYQRSLPTNQLNNMLAAGLSKQAAINKLTGGGVYTAPSLQTAQMQAQHVDYSGMMSGINEAMERVASAPANVMQQRMVATQMDSLRQEMRLRDAEELRKQQQHEYEMWQRMHDKETATRLDSATSVLFDGLMSSGRDISEFKNYENLVRGLGLQDRKELQGLPYLTHSQLFDAVRSRFDEERARQTQENANQASKDSHALSLLEQSLRKVDLKYYDKEKHEQLLNLMRVGQGLIEDNNIKFQDRNAKEMENFVREAGIDSERDARALAEYVRKLEQDDELDIQMRRSNANKFTLGVHNQARVLLRDLGELLMKVKL